MPHQIELRKIKYMASLSEETHCYTADLYVDGALLAHVSNHGHGGCDSQHAAKGKTYRDIEALNDEIKATYPKRSFEAGGKTHEYDQDLESICGELVDDFLVGRDLDRILNRTVMFVEKGKLLSFKGKMPANVKTAMIEKIRREKADAIILNTLPRADAIHLYKAHG